MNITDAKNRLLQEDLGDFKLGQSKSTSTGKHTITDIDDTTGSVTWKISKDLDEEEIYNDLTKIIEKLEKIKVNKFHKNPKAYQLTKDLKTIRNKLSRTIVKEDKQHLIKTLKGILNEIKINNPNIVNINDLVIGRKYKFIVDEGIGTGETIKMGEVIEIDKNPLEGDLRIELHTPEDEYEYQEIYSDEIIKIIANV